MHDPNTVAFEIRNPFGRKRYGHRPHLITIWHRDKGGIDGACGWTTHATLTEAEEAYAERLIKDPHDNLKHWFPETQEWEQIAHLKVIFRLHKAKFRPWFKHPRWHFWHWHFQVHPWEKLKRSFTRCTLCNYRFRYGYQTVRSGNGIYHSHCLDQAHKNNQHERAQQFVEQMKAVVNS